MLFAWHTFLPLKHTTVGDPIWSIVNDVSSVTILLSPGTLPRQEITVENETAALEEREIAVKR